MILQDHGGPHQFAPDFNTIYYFLVLAPVLVLVLLYLAWKTLTYFEKRKADSGREKSDLASGSAKKEG